MALPTTHTRTPRRSRATVALAVLATALLAACSPAEPEVPAPVTVTPTVEADRSAPPEPVIPVVWPLTGVETEEVAARPALAVKVENTTSARPQTGLDQADVVWETIVEFEVSRFIAVFHSQVPAEVGPIRSVRPMDPLVVAPLQGLLAYSGGQSGILSQVQGSGVQSLSHDAGAPGMYRVSFRRAPHNVYGEPETFWAAADAGHSAPPAEQFAFARTAEDASAVVAGAPATTLAFRMSSQARPTWTWDAEAGRWLRAEGSTPATTPDGDRLSAVNVVAIDAAHVASGFRAQGGAAVPTYELVGSGSATVATGGKYLDGTWSKESPEAPLVLLDEAGEPLTLAPGNTWVELVPLGSGSLTVS
ncbi:DUF3048 domain-containing protein [Cellulomonas sp. APG4]|uniref:DUF3048 domain-containing protein n=1 Tax=Cellulomonas sp. APG4 TaxID=1538656 RepID=UPI00351B9019